MPLDLKKPGELEAVYDTIKKKWGKLDIEPAGELVAALRGAERNPDGVRDRPVGREGIAGDHDEAPPLQMRDEVRAGPLRAAAAPRYDGRWDVRHSACPQEHGARALAAPSLPPQWLR